jgi:hypothetical protein
MPDWLAVSGLILGAIGLGFALVGLWMRRRETRP